MTRIEVPSDVVFSPGSDGRAIAEPAPITVGDVTELWRLRFGTLAGTVEEASVAAPLALRPSRPATCPTPSSAPSPKPSASSW